MNDIVFARTRHQYDSYSDFWRLVELSGFETCYVDEIRLEETLTYIMAPINGEHRPHIDNERFRLERAGLVRRASLIWWNLERPDSPDGYGADVEQVTTDILRYVDEVWVSDLYYQSLDKRQVFVPFGSHPDLALTHVEPRQAGRAYDYDVTLLSYMAPRRERIVRRLKGLGLRVAPACWGEERDHMLRSTRVMLNVHQHSPPLPIAEPLRFAIAAAYRMALVSEPLMLPMPLVPGKHYLDVGYDRLAQTCRELAGGTSGARGPVHVALLGEALHQLLCVEKPFRARVREALERS